MPVGCPRLARRQLRHSNSQRDHQPSNIQHGLNNKRQLDKHTSIKERTNALVIQSNKSPDPMVRTLALIYNLIRTDLLLRIGSKRRNRGSACILRRIDG